MARLFERKENQATYVEGTQSRIELSRNYQMQALLCKLTVKHTNGAHPVFNDAMLFALINSIEVVANGNENIKQLPSSKLYIDNIISTSRLGLKDIVVTPNVADKESYVFFKIDFSMPNSARPHDTILNTSLFTTFGMLINWGSSNTIGTDIDVKSATIEVASTSLVGYTRNKGETIKYFKESSLSEEITSTTSEFTITMPVKKLYRAITIMSTVDNKRNDNVIKRVIIKSGTTVFVDWDFDFLRAMNNMEFKPESASSLTGICVIDFAKRGRLSDVLNTVASFNTLEIVLSVEKQTGNNKVHVFSDCVEDTNVVEVP